MAARYALDSFVFSTVLAVPSGLAAAPNVGGGSFAAATYFWKVTGVNAGGETTGSNEATTAVALNGTATLTWSALPSGTTGTRVYRGTVTNTENVLVATLGAVVTYTDTGTAGVAGAPPAANSAYVSSMHIEAGSLRDSASAAVTANPTAFSVTPPVAGVGHVSGRLLQHLSVYPQGAEVSLGGMMAKIAADTFVAQLADGTERLVVKGEPFRDDHELVARDAKGTGLLFRDLDLGEEPPPKSSPEAKAEPAQAVKPPNAGRGKATRL